MHAGIALTDGPGRAMHNQLAPQPLPTHIGHDIQIIEQAFFDGRHRRQHAVGGHKAHGVTGIRHCDPLRPQCRRSNQAPKVIAIALGVGRGLIKALIIGNKWQY